jgi:hypothetical protein
MAHTFNLKKFCLDPQNNVMLGFGTITLVDDYSAGGWAITPAALGLASITFLHPLVDFLDGATATDASLHVKLGSNGAYNIEVWKDDGVSGIHTEYAGTASDFDGKIIPILFTGPGAVTAGS